MLCVLYVGTVLMLCILIVGTVPTLCILNVGTVPTFCISNAGTVPTFSASNLVLPQWPSLFVSSTWSTSMISIICLFELVLLNGLLFDKWVDHVVKELNVKEVQKLPIFVPQKAAAPKNGVEFRQGSNGTIRSSLATSYDVARRLVCVWKLFWNLCRDQQTNRPTNIPIPRCFVAEA